MLFSYLALRLFQPKYNLTDEILRRLKVHKDFDELYDEIQKTDTNNQIVVEFLEDGISLVDEDGSQSVKKAKLKDVESKPMPGDVKKKTGQEDLSSSKDDEKKPEKTAVDTEYIVQGDGFFRLFFRILFRLSFIRFIFFRLIFQF